MRACGLPFDHLARTDWGRLRSSGYQVFVSRLRNLHEFPRRTDERGHIVATVRFGWSPSPTTIFLRQHRFQAEGECRRPARSTATSVAARPAAGLPSNLEAAGGPAPEGRSLAIENTGSLRPGAGMCACGELPDDARLRHQDHPVDRQGKPVPADNRQPGVALTGLGWRNSSSTVAPSRITSPSWTGAVSTCCLLTNVGCWARKNIAIAVADQRGVVPRKIAHQRDIGLAVGTGTAEDDLIVQTDEISADRIDPEQKTAARAVVRAGQRSRRGGRLLDEALIQAIGAKSAGVAGRWV